MAREDVKPLFEKRETEAGASDQVQILTDMILGKGERQGHDSSKTTPWWNG